MRQSAQENNEPTKEPSTVLEVANTEKIIEVPEVIIEPPQVDPNMAWKMFVDEKKNSLGAGAGASVVLKNLEGAIFEYCLRLNFPAMNNKAEYEAFIVGL